MTFTERGKTILHSHIVDRASHNSSVAIEMLRKIDTILIAGKGIEITRNNMVLSITSDDILSLGVISA